jgi:hypothetical protein
VKAAPTSSRGGFRFGWPGDASAVVAHDGGVRLICAGWVPQDDDSDVNVTAVYRRASLMIVLFGSMCALSGCSPVACAENDMHLRQIADDTARDVQHQRRSARRKMTRILRIDSHLDVIIRHKSQARVMSCRGGSGRLLSVAVRLLFFFKRTDDVYGGAEGREQVTRMAGRK